MKLIIGNKNYSSWSLRPWILLRQAEIPFEEERLGFNAPDFAEQARRYSPTGRVPVLIDGDVVVWDSLAIAEYVAERFPEKALWPEDRAARARARSVCAEMHAGFQDMRSRLPMNCEAHFPAPPLDVGVRRDIARVVDIWLERERFSAGGPFLFGRFSVADAFYAPVAIRFAGFNVPLPPVAAAYRDTLLGLPAMQAWIAAGKAENDFVEKDEPYREAPRR
jgi:glutathione S-transferase